MTVLRQNELLEEAMLPILESGNSEYFILNVSLYSKNDPEFVLELDQVIKMYKKQTFNNDLSNEYHLTSGEGNYADQIWLDARINPSEYIATYDHKQDLYIKIQREYVDIDTNEMVLDKPPVDLEYICHLEGNADLYKKYSKAALIGEEDGVADESHLANRVDITLSLFPEKLYNLRHKKMNAICDGTMKPLTITKLIRYICQLFGIPNIHMVPVDNEYEYTHLIIPILGFDTIFNYIQEEYGVYSQGLSYYYTNDTLYIYPPYDIKPEILDTTINVYNAVPGSYLGLRGYHTYIEKDLHILSTSDSDTRTSVDIGFENDGNSISHLRADRLIDKFSITTEEKPLITKDNTTTVEHVHSGVLNKKSNHISYKKPAVNTYKYSSDIAKNVASYVTTQWVNCLPDSIYPGQRVKYHYDNDGVYTTKLGKIDYIDWEIVPEDRISEKAYYTCVATMILRLEP